MATTGLGAVLAEHGAHASNRARLAHPALHRRICNFPGMLMPIMPFRPLLNHRWSEKQCISAVFAPSTGQRFVVFEPARPQAAPTKSRHTYPNC